MYSNLPWTSRWAGRLFSFTNSSTKIAYIPTVTGNCTSIASRKASPLGSANLSSILARAVSTPTRILPLGFIVRPLVQVAEILFLTGSRFYNAFMQGLPL